MTAVQSPAEELVERTAHYVDGRWVPPTPGGPGPIPVADSATERPFGSGPGGGAADVEAAVAAARRAFPAWAATAPDERAALLDRVADGLEARARELVVLISRETGMPRHACVDEQVGPALDTVRAAAALARTYPFVDARDGYEAVRSPVGVVACITPWNYPLLQVAAKVAFALAAGCTVVLKPSEVAPLDAFVLAEVVDVVGVPAGAFNLVGGTGPDVGEPLAGHPDVDMVSFTGSTRAGTRVAELCAPHVTRVALELGGKSPSILLDDLDDAGLAEAVEASVLGAYANSGQTCSATSRMLVPRARAGDAVDLAAGVARSLRVGDPADPATDLGPLASAAQWERVQEHLRRGIDEGARLAVGGPGRPDGLEVGWYARPTVFADVEPGMHVAREELFGPVLSVLAYDDLDGAVALANDTGYGLSGAVWSADRDRARSVALRLRTGEVDLNGGGDWSPMQPFGGFGRSGIGREYGVEGFEEFLEVTTIR